MTIEQPGNQEPCAQGRLMALPDGCHGCQGDLGKQGGAYDVKFAIRMIACILCS